MINNLTKITLRNTLLLKVDTVLKFNKILNFSDTPYNFDQIKKYLWRWYADIYGFFYNRVKKNYFISLTMALKKNISIYMPFIFKMPNKRSKLLDKYKKRSFLYKNSYFLYYTNELILNINYLLPKKHWLSIESNEILNPRNIGQRPINSFGNFNNEIDMFFSCYNYNWYDIYNYKSSFYKVGRMPKNFLIIVNSFFINSNIFINSFDSNITIYPQYYLEYYNNLYNKDIINLFTFFNIKMNNNLYLNILNYLDKIYLNFFTYNFKKLKNIFSNKDLNLLLIKYNIYFYFLNFNVYYKNIKIYNLLYFYLFYFNQFNFLKLYIYNNFKKLNNYKFLYLNYFKTLKFKNNLLKLNNKTYNYKYDFFFKILNKLYLINVSNIYKLLYLKKIYLFEIIYLWNILKNKKNIIKKNLKKKISN